MRAACVQCRVRKVRTLNCWPIVTYRWQRLSVSTNSPKVRCDGTAPCCRPCERLRFECSFAQAGSKTLTGYVVQLPPKRRGTEACLECRTMKARCSRDSPRCTNCHRRNKQCTYASAIVSSSATTQRDSRMDIDSFPVPPQQPSSIPSEQARNSSVTSPNITSPFSTSSGSTFLSDEIATYLVAKYFDCLSPLPSFGFLHKETVLQRCLDGSIDYPLKLAICAITSMFIGQYQTQRIEWAQESELIMLGRLEKPSIFLIQASLLTIRFRAAVGQFPRAFILAGLAARWAVALRLNYEHSGLGPVAQEVRRRTLWSLYMLEDSLCVGLKEFELLSPEIMHLQLPCEDSDFSDERPTFTGYLQPGKGIEPDVLGSRAAFIKLALIRREVIRYCLLGPRVYWS